jgi:hypothetical protein
LSQRDKAQRDKAQRDKREVRPRQGLDRDRRAAWNFALSDCKIVFSPQRLFSLLQKVGEFAALRHDALRQVIDECGQRPLGYIKMAA